MENKPIKLGYSNQSRDGLMVTFAIPSEFPEEQVYGFFNDLTGILRRLDPQITSYSKPIANYNVSTPTLEAVENLKPSSLEQYLVVAPNPNNPRSFESVHSLFHRAREPVYIDGSNMMLSARNPRYSLDALTKELSTLDYVDTSKFLPVTQQETKEYKTQ